MNKSFNILIRVNDLNQNLGLCSYPNAPPGEPVTGLTLQDTGAAALASIIASSFPQL